MSKLFRYATSRRPAPRRRRTRGGGISPKAQQQIASGIGWVLGRAATFLGGMFSRSTRTSRQQIETAAEMLEDLGIELETEPGDPGYEREVEQAAAEVLEEMAPPQAPPPGSADTAGAADEPPQRPSGAVVVEPRWSARKALEPPMPGTDSPLSPEILTPRSSNVYSFQYDYSSSTLLVRFKAPKLDGDKVFNVKGGGMKAGGGVHKGKTNDPGPLYAYLDVPVRVFRRIASAQSAGKAVWDELRIRGTIYGHQYRYMLVQGAVVPGESGRLATYVPRRATVRGFRKRATPVVGTGKRAWIESTLPERLRAAPDRGEPNRGTPNRG